MVLPPGTAATITGGHLAAVRPQEAFSCFSPLLQPPIFQPC